MPSGDRYSNPVQRSFDPIFDERGDYSGGATANRSGLANSTETWDYAEYGEVANESVSYRQPTVREILNRQGIRAAINYKCERLCVGALADMHADAKQHGVNLSRPDYKTPWWFKWVSRLEWYTRPKKKK